MKAHDAVSGGVTPGVNYYLDELSRRETKRLTESIRNLTRVSTVFVVISTIFVIITALR